VLWYNRRKTSTRQVAVAGTNGKEYKRRTKVTMRPRKEWVGVPVPDVGIPKWVVEAAREVLLENTAAKNSSGRFWELSGGVARCALCGWRMVMQTRRRGKNTYYYYRCAHRQAEGKNGCPNGRHWSALQLEGAVFDAVSAFLLDPDRMRSQLADLVERERVANMEDPQATETAWLERLAELDAKRGRFQDMAAEGLITMDELRAKLGALDEHRVAAQRELAAAKAHRERLAQLECDVSTLIETYSGMVPTGLANLTPEERNQIYRILRLRADVGADGEIELSGVIDVCTTGVTS
jgi:hypothetical protein